MSIAAMNWAWKQADLPPSQKLVLMALADNADDEGVCWPGQRYLAEKCCCSTRTVSRLLGKLHERGLVQREERARSNGSRTSDLMTLALGDNLSGPPRHGCQGQNHQGNVSLTGTDELQGTLVENVGGKRGKNPADQLFDIWLEANGHDPKRYRKTTKRMSLLKARLKDSEFDEIEAAIRNVAADKWYRENNRTDLTLICRNREHIEQYRDMRPKDGKHFEMERSADEMEFPF